MSDFIREVDEAVAHDRASALLKRYRFVLVGIVLAILAGVMGFQAYQAHQKFLNEQASQKYEAALILVDSGKEADAEGALTALIESAPAGYKILTRFLDAANLGKSNPARGIAAYDELASDTSLEPSLRALASLRAAILALNQDVPNQDAKNLIARLDPQIASDQPFAASARELRASLALALGDYDTAGRMVDMVEQDPTTPDSLRQRIEILGALVRSDKPLPAAKP